MSYADRLQKLVEYQNSIRSALTEKGATISSNSTFKDFPAAVGTITGDYDGPTPVDFAENGMAAYLSMMSNATRIASYAFVGTSLSEVNLPYCSVVGEYAFSNCTSLSSVNLPECKNINGSVFYWCTNLNNISAPKCEYMGYSAFANCSNLKSVCFPKLTSGDAELFSGCRYLKSANLPRLQFAYSTFRGCFGLIDVNMPEVSYLSAMVFNGCSYLESLNFNSLNNISCGTYAATFGGCFNLRSLYIKSPSVCTLSTSYAFSATPILGVFNSTYCTKPGVYGSVFVPYSLINSYREATNWTYLSSRIAGLVNLSVTNLSEGDTIITVVDGKVFSTEMEVPDTSFTYSVYSKYPKYEGTQNDVEDNSTINMSLPTEGVTLTINTTPEDATVKITEDGIADIYAKTKVLNIGDVIDYEVSAEPPNTDTYYKSQNGSISVEQDTVLNVSLEERYIDTVTLPEITHYPEEHADILGDNMFEVYNTTQLRTAEKSGQTTEYFTKYFIYNTLDFKSNFKAKIKRDQMKSYESYIGMHFTINKELDEATYRYRDLQKELPVTDSRIFDLYLNTGGTEYDINVELEPNTTYYVQFLVACYSVGSLGSGCYGYITDMTLYYDGGPVE